MSGVHVRVIDAAGIAFGRITAPESGLSADDVEVAVGILVGLLCEMRGQDPMVMAAHVLQNARNLRQDRVMMERVQQRVQAVSKAGALYVPGTLDKVALEYTHRTPAGKLKELRGKSGPRVNRA